MEQDTKRLSILKKPTRYEQSPANTVTKSLRRISFSGTKSVKEFIAGSNEATIWGTSYEEDANHASAASVKDSSTVDLSAATSNLNLSGMMLRNRKVLAANMFSEVNKENIGRIDNDTMEFTNSINIASSSDNRTFERTIDVTLNTFELENFKFNRAALCTLMKENTKADGGPVDGLHSDESAEAIADSTQSFYCSFLTEKHRDLLRKQREHIVDEPNRFHSALDQLKFDDSPVEDAENVKDNKKGGDDDMDISFEGSPPGKPSGNEVVTNKVKIGFHHGEGIQDRPSSHNSESGRKTIVFHKELSMDAFGISSVQTDSERLTRSRRTIMPSNEDMDVENIPPQLQEPDIKGGCKRKTIIFKKGKEIEEAAEHNLLLRINDATHNAISNDMQDMSVFQVKESLGNFPDELEKNKNLAEMVNSRGKARQTQIFDNGERIDEVSVQTNPIRPQCKTRHTLVFDDGERIEEVASKRKTCIFNDESINVDKGKDDLRRKSQLVSANVEETPVTKVEGHPEVVPSSLKQSESKIPSSVVKVTKFSFQNHPRKTLIFPRGGEDIQHESEEPGKPKDKQSSPGSIFVPKARHTLYFNEDIEGSVKGASSEDMDGFFEFPPPSEKSVAGNYQKSMDHALKTRRETTLTEGNMDETNISAGENTENTSLRMIRKLEERLSVAQKSSEGTSDFSGFDITGTNVNESVNKKVSFREKREQQVDIAAMDFNKSKFQAADMPHRQASLNKGGSTSGRRATIFLNEDIECDPPQNLVDSNPKEFECKKLFPPEIQGKKNDPRRTQTFSGEIIDEDVDNIGSCERALDKTHEKSILNEASLPVLSLPETTPIPSKPRPTLLFKNGEPIESEGELSRSDARKGIEQNKSKLQTYIDISLKQAQFKETEKILTKRGTIFFHENNGMDFDLSNNVLACDAVGSESINPTTSKSRPTMHFKKGEPIETEDDLDRSKAHRAHLQRMTFANEAENMEVESSLNYIDHPDKKIISAGNSVIKAINSQKAYSNETSEKRREQSSTLKEDFGISSKQPRFKTIDSELECVPIPLHSHARKGLVFQIDQRIQPSFEDTHKAAEESRSKAIGSGTNVRQTIFFNEAIGTSTEANVGKGSNQNRKTLHFSDLKMEIDQLLEPLSISGEEVDMKSSEMCRQNNARRTILQRADLDETHMVAQKNTSIFELFKAKNSSEINSSKSAENSNIRAPQMGQSDLTESTTNINTNSSGGQLNTFRNVIVPNSANKSHRPEPVANPRRTVIFNKESILEDSFGNNKSHTQPHQSFASSHFPNRNPECSQNSLKDIKRRETILVPVDMDESTDCLEKVNNSKAQNKELKSDRQQHSLAYHQQLDYSHSADIDLSLRESEQRNQSEVNNVAGTAEISMLQRRKSEQSVNLSSTNRSAAPSNEASYTQRPNRGTFVIYRDKEPVDGESPETSQASAKKGFENSSWTLSDNRPRLLRSARDSIYLSRTAQCPLIPGSLHTTTSSADFSANTTAALCNLDPNCITGAGYKRCFNKNYATEETVDKQLKYNGADNTMKLEIDGIQGDYDDIDKTQIDLVNSTLLDSSEKDELCEASVMIVEIMNSEESSANSKKSMLEEKEKFLCRKCRNCQKTLNDTTLAEFRLKEEEEENLVINFDALKRLKGKPRFPDVLKEFKERRLSNSFNSTYEESVLLPLVPSTDFLLQNYSDEYMQKLEEKSQLKSLVPAIYPVIRPFEYLFRNRLETEKCNWNFNNLHLPVGILECQHRKVRNIRLIIKFDRHDLYKANASQLQFNQVSMQKSNLYKNPSTFERVVQNEIFLQVPSDLTAFCSSSIDLFTFLETVDSICDKSYQLAKGLLKVTFSNRSSLQCNESGNCVVKKVVNNESNTATNGNRFEFLIRVRNIEKMCSDDIIMPPRSYFKDHVKTLPIGLAFLDKFLKSPDKYLL